jgi:hypothetical protein
MRQFADGTLDRPATAGLVHALFELLSLLIVPPPRIGFRKSVLRPVLLLGVADGGRPDLAPMIGSRRSPFLIG